MEHLNYKTGDVFHCKGKGLISKGIKFFTESDITHSAMFIWIWGEPFIIDSQKDGTNLRPFYKWKEKYDYDYIVTRSNKTLDEKAFALNAMSLSGITGYDFELFVLRYPFSIIRSKITGEDFLPKVVPNETKRMICSEFVAWAHDLLSPSTYTPKRLHEHCVKYQWKIISICENNTVLL